MNLKENIAYLKYFGFKLTFWKTLNKIFSRDCKYKKLSWKILDINNDKIEDYIRLACPVTYSKLKKGVYDNIDKVENSDVDLLNNVIWTVWWQGEENAPEIVKMCINSMRKHCNGHKVIVLDEKNYKDYVKLPEIIEQRYNEGKIDTTDLKKITLDQTKISDIVRTYLLYNYGGIWADATMFFSDDIPEDLFDAKWITLGQDDEWYIGRGRWSTFFMGGGSGLGLTKFIYDMHIEYWANKGYYVNYLMIDHMYDIACKERSDLNQLIEDNPCPYRKSLTVSRKKNDEVDEKAANEFFKNQKIHKLSWRWWGRDKETKIQKCNRETTWLEYLLENYGENEE